MWKLENKPVSTQNLLFKVQEAVETIKNKL